mgnify:CR=1 FL=1
MVEETGRNGTTKKEVLSYQIIDNFLDTHEFEFLQTKVMEQEHSWYYGESVADELKYENEAYFMHLYYMDMPEKIKDRLPTKSESFDLVKPIIRKIDHNFLLRVKANLYGRTETLKHHPDHQDYHFEHMGAVFYVNTNDGFTVLDDGTEIGSIENRLLLFNGATMHHSTTCTDKKRRVTINFNFM